MNGSPAHAPVALAPEPSIKEYLSLILKRKTAFIQTFIAVLVLGIVSTARHKPVYQTSAKLLVPASSPSLRLVDSSNPIAAMLAATQPDSLSTQMEILQSGQFVAEAQRRAGIVPKEGVMPPFPNVESVEGTNVILITVRGGDPQDAANLANAMVDLHLERTDLMATGGLRETIEFVEKEREKAAQELAAAERALIAFRRDHKIAELTAKQEVETKEYVALQVKVRETGSQITSAKAQIAELRARLAKEPLDIVQMSAKTNPRRTRLQAKLDDLEGQRTDLLQDFLPTSQRVRALDERIASLTRQIAAQPETIRVRTHSPNLVRPNLQSRLMGLEADLEGYQAAHRAAVAQFETRKGVVDNLGPWEVHHSRFIQNRDAAQGAYTNFSDRLRDLEIRSRARMQTTRALARAVVPSAPNRPDQQRGILFSAVLALCLAVGVVFLLEHLDDRVDSPADVERLAALPTLGHVPLIGPEQSRMAAILPTRSHVAEAYRALRSSIGFAGADSPIRRLVVTSASQGEGKTVTSVNLAMAFAADGKRVILVDADLRRPSVHRLLERPGSPGLSELLVARSTLEEVLQETEVENLRVICAGSIPPNPAELLGTQAFRTLLQELDEQADLLLLDTPPCLPVTDPLIVATQADGVVLVINAGATRKEAVRQAVELLNRAHARMLGVLFNRVQASQGGRYYHHYYYQADGDGEGEPGHGHRRNGRERRLALQNGAMKEEARSSTRNEG